MVSFTREMGQSKLYEEIIVKGKVDTISKAFEYVVRTFQHQDCLGTRQILGIPLSICPNIEITSLIKMHQI